MIKLKRKILISKKKEKLFVTEKQLKQMLNLSPAVGLHHNFIWFKSIFQLEYDFWTLYTHIYTFKKKKI